MTLLIGWAIRSVALFLLPFLMSAVQLRSPWTAVGVALLIGLLNTFIRPVLFLLTLPVTVVTLGAFMLVINGLMFWVASRLVDGFYIESFGWAIVASILYSIISWAIETLLVRETLQK